MITSISRKTQNQKPRRNSKVLKDYKLLISILSEGRLGGESSMKKREIYRDQQTDRLLKRQRDRFEDRDTMRLKSPKKKDSDIETWTERDIGKETDK